MIVLFPLKSLLDTQEHCFPSLLIEKDINFERTINKAQGFWGDPKVILFSYSRLMLVQQHCTEYNWKFQNFSIFLSYRSYKNGIVMSEENSAAINGINNEPFFIYCHLKNHLSDYSLPCR